MIGVRQTPFKPTDVVLDKSRLFVANGYGSNYILSGDIATPQWAGLFGGKTENPAEYGTFGPAHGINLEPFTHHLAIADRMHGRIQIHHHDARFINSHKLPPGTWPQTHQQSTITHQA